MGKTERPLMPRIRCKINETAIFGLINTAATANFVQKLILSEDQQKSIRPHSMDVELAVPSTTLKIQGEIEVQVTIGQRLMELTCLFSEELRESLIFVLPWIRKQKVVMDIPNGILYAGIRERFPLYLTMDSKERPAM